MLSGTSDLVAPLSVRHARGSDSPSRKRTGPAGAAIRAVAGGLLLWLASTAASAQDMPDPSLIHGRALPAPELAVGTVTVRVVREAIGNNVAGQQVRLTVGAETRTATTDELGRAEFTGLASGAEVRAEATVEGEALISQPFAVPASGGLRVILVAGIERATERRQQEAAAAASAPPTKGVVVFGGNTRVLMQFDNDALQVFYVLEIVNSARTRVDTGGPLTFELPPAASGAAPLEGSSPAATVDGRNVTIAGPFDSGTTSVQIAYRLRHDSPELTFEQTWPAAMQQVTVGVEKVGDLQMASTQFAATNDVRTEAGDVFVLGSGPGLPAGGTLTVTLSNLPVHSRTPRNVALALALAIGALGIWLAASNRPAAASSRDQLINRRESLLGDLAQLESKRRAGTVNAERYASRRQRIVSELERIYGELDEEGVGPPPGGKGVAA